MSLKADSASSFQGEVSDSPGEQGSGPGEASHQIHQSHEGMQDLY